MSSKYSSLNNHILSHFFSNKKLFLKKKKTSKFSFHRAFPWDYHYNSFHSRNAFCILPISFQKILKMCLVKSGDLLKLISFTAYEWGQFSGFFFSPFSLCMTMKDTMIQTQYRKKSNNVLTFSLKKVWPYWTLKWFGGSSVFHGPHVKSR